MFIKFIQIEYINICSALYFPLSGAQGFVYKNETYAFISFFYLIAYSLNQWTQSQLPELWNRKWELQVENHSKLSSQHIY